jgi:outer membrane protein assembly factor BamB
VASGVSPNIWQGKIIARSPKRFLCVEPKTGKVVWELAEENLITKSTPAVNGGFMLAQGRQGRHGGEKVLPEYRGLTGYRITAEKCEKLWALDWPAFAGNWSPPLIHDGYGYAVCGGGLTCVEMATGKVVAQLKGVGDGKLPLLAGNGVLFAGLEMVALNPTNLVSLGKFKVNKELYTPVAVSEGRLFVRGRLAGWGKDSQPPEPDCFYCMELRKP